MSGGFKGMVLSSCILGLLSLGYLKSVHSEPTYGNVSSKASEVKERIVGAIATQDDEPILDPDPPVHIKALDLKLVERFSREMGLQHTPKVIYTCEWGDSKKFGAIFSSDDWTLGICRKNVGETENVYQYRIFAIAHEIGHAIDFQQGLTTSEMSADGRAVDYLASIGFWEPIRAKADNTNSGAYKPGQLYAQQVLSKAGKL